VWAVTKGSGVRVCILDTGIDFNHPDLKDAVEDMKDFTGSKSGPYDVNGHGTHCAGIIAARSNSVGVIGVAPESKILIGKVLDDNGFGTMNYIKEGIEWAIAKKADIISMSLGAYSGDANLEAAIKKAFDAGIMIIAASGNDGLRDFISFPARYKECIAVGSINKLKQKSNYSNGGADLDVLAPGEEIFSTFKGGLYVKLSGTSMATPFVAGIAALILSKHKLVGGQTPINNNNDLFNHLTKTAIDIGLPGFDFETGFGLINPNKSVTTASLAISAPQNIDADRRGCIERVYDKERERKADHKDALDRAKEVCAKMIITEPVIMSKEGATFYILGNDGCVERVYDRERNRGADHKDALDRAKDVCAKGIELVSELSSLQLKNNRA
jgi:subtilisin family serine protease